MFVFLEQTVTRASMPNHNNVRVPGAYDYQSIHAANHSNVRFRRAYGHQSIHAANHNNVRVPRAYDYESIHAQTIITFVFLEQTVTRASMTQP